MRSKLALLVLCLLVSCGGKLTVDSYEPGYQPEHAGATANGGSTSMNDAGKGPSEAGSASSSGNTAGGGLSGAAGALEHGGEGAVNGGASDGGASDGGATTCEDARDDAGDCHRLSCDRSNHVLLEIDQTDIPTLANPCLAGTCNSAGKPGAEPRTPRTPCHDAANGALCDGAGRCLQCLETTDCPAKQYCEKGGVCGAAPCTDDDCGGACPACQNGKKCLIDDDCASDSCDSLTHTCNEDWCTNHHQDHNETDADCGGGVCPGCPLSQECQLDLDCASNACDAASFTCISNQCADHRQDGMESDKDCGGGICANCGIGKKCKSSFDCADGLCAPTAPHVCYLP